jgi:enoyl-CoA hydratase
MKAVEGGDLVFERQDGVAWVTFNRPDARTAMTFDMYDDLHDLCEEIDRDPDVRAVVLRGAGDKSFAAGTDIRQFLTFETREDALGYEARIARVLWRLAAVTKPTIAMVQGDAVGGGLFLALACDLRFAADHARFGAPVARTLGNCTAPWCGRGRSCSVRASWRRARRRRSGWSTRSTRAPSSRRACVSRRSD